MVHLDKVEGQTGSMVLHDDGSIISSTGDLASSEQTAQTIISLITHALQVDFTPHENGANNGNGSAQNGYVNPAVTTDNGSGEGGGVVSKWNRITVSFEDHSYVACLSNKRIHVIKKDVKPVPPTTAEPDMNNE